MIFHGDLNYQGHGDLKSDLQPSFYLKYQSICYTTQLKNKTKKLHASTPICKLLLTKTQCADALGYILPPPPPPPPPPQLNHHQRPRWWIN